jgi:hypothetical protein
MALTTGTGPIARSMHPAMRPEGQRSSGSGSVSWEDSAITGEMASRNGGLVHWSQEIKSWRWKHWSQTARNVSSKRPQNSQSGRDIETHAWIAELSVQGDTGSPCNAGTSWRNWKPTAPSSRPAPSTITAQADVHVALLQFGWLGHHEGRLYCSESGYCFLTLRTSQIANPTSRVSCIVGTLPLHLV